MSDESAKRDNARKYYYAEPFGDQHFQRYVKHPGIDIGCAPYPPAFDFVGLSPGYPGYDGLKLPFEDEKFQTVHSSHCLEHLEEPTQHIEEWFRVLAVGGHLIINVPHRDLYEKKEKPPSRFNKDHKLFWTPFDLLAHIEAALKSNTYRLIYCRDNDWGYDYSIPPREHPKGCYEVECVIRKIQPPTWGIE